VVMDWQRLINLGAMSPQSVEQARGNALAQALMGASAAFHAAGAPSRVPGGRPLNLAPVFQGYQNSLANSVKQALMLRQLERQEEEYTRKKAEREAIKTALTSRPETRHVPTGAQLKVTDLSYQPKLDWRGNNMPTSGPGSDWNTPGYDGFNPSQTVLAPETRAVTEETNPLLKSLSPGMRHVVSALAAGGYGKEALAPILTAAAKTTTPYSPLGKLHSDYRRRLISKDEYEAGVAKAVQLTQPKDPKSQTDIMDREGNYLGIRIWDHAANNGQGGFVVRQGSGKSVPFNNTTMVPVNKSAFSIGALPAKELNKLENEIGSHEKSLRDLVRYSKSQGGTDIGFQRIANTFTERLKVLLGNTDYAPEELSQRIAKGQLQGLLGQLRVETVGPGVMTEFDAQRVIARLGGNVDAWQNPKVVEGLIREIFDDKKRSYTRLVNQYNSQQRFYDDKVFTPLRIREFDLQQKYSRKAYPGMEIGNIDNGYEYLGGDPNDPKSWKLIK